MSEIGSPSTSGKPVGVDGSKALNPDEFGTYLGLVSWLATMSKEHRELPISHIDRKILPAILFKQFKIIRKEKMPVAFLAWATVSDEVKARLGDPEAQLELAEWRSGPHVLIVECIAPFGGADTVKQTFLDGLKKPH